MKMFDKIVLFIGMIGIILYIGIMALTYYHACIIKDMMCMGATNYAESINCWCL
jgi:hypothetical protein